MTALVWPTLAACLWLAPVAATPPPIHYAAPAGAAQVPRFASTARGPTNHSRALTTLVPEHAAQSATSQPTLHWYRARGHPGSTRIVIANADGRGEPLLRQTLGGAFNRDGVHSLNLAEHGPSGTALQPGRAYRWTISLRGADGRALTRELAQGVVVWHGPLRERAPVGADDATLARHYAGEGFWYDALAAAMRHYRRSAPNTEAASLLGELLATGGLALDVAGPGAAPALVD